MENLDQKMLPDFEPVVYSEVIEQHDKIIIVASSREAKKFKPLDGYVVIAVNAAINITKEYTDYWITVDLSETNLDILRNKPYNHVKYYAAIPPHFGTEYALLPRHRNLVLDDVHYLERIASSNNGPKAGLAEDKSQIHTGNSAYGALGLAYHMQPKEIIILGVNGNRTSPKFDNKYCRGDLSHLKALFSSAKPQLDDAGINVFNANRFTIVDCFDKIDPFID